MKIEFTDHAKKRMRERNLLLRQIEEFVRNPDSREISTKNSRRFLIKKTYYHPALKKNHLLMAICEEDADKVVVITIIDTSKIRKYTKDIW